MEQSRGESQMAFVAPSNGNGGRSHIDPQGFFEWHSYQNLFQDITSSPSATKKTSPNL
jgi:hypothetical protein